MGKSAFVTGVAGFIGTNLTKELINDGYKVVALTRKRQSCHLSHDNLKIVEGDIIDRKYLLDIVKGADVVFHCAAFISFSPRDFKKSYEINVLGTKNVLEAAFRNGLKKMVHLSAASVLGYTKNPREIIDEEREFNVSKRSSYVYTKKIAEEEVRNYVNKGLDASIANITTVYGAGDRKMNSGSVIRAVYSNKVKFAPAGGTSYVSVNDLVRGLIMLSEKGKRGERYIFCSENLRYFELLNRIAKALERKPIRYIIPRWTNLAVSCIFSLKDFLLKASDDKVNLLTTRIIKESYFYKYYSSRKARDVLGWQPKLSLEEAARQALDFYLKERLI